MARPHSVIGCRIRKRYGQIGGAYVLAVFLCLADLERTGHGRDLYPGSGHRSDAVLFYLPVYGLQYKKGTFDVQARAMVPALFLGAGGGDRQGEHQCPEIDLVAGNGAGACAGIF